MLPDVSNLQSRERVLDAAPVIHFIATLVPQHRRSETGGCFVGTGVEAVGGGGVECEGGLQLPRGECLG